MENYNKTMTPVTFIPISRNTIRTICMILFSAICITIFLTSFKAYYLDSHTYHLTREYDESITPEEEEAIKAVDASGSRSYK